MITAKEAKSLVGRDSRDLFVLDPLIELGRMIREAAQQGCYQIIVEGLSNESHDWLTSNGYVVWTQLTFNNRKYLISWEHVTEDG